MTRAELVELRDRIAKATGPDREIDCALAESVEVCGSRFDPATHRGDGHYWEGKPEKSRYIGTAPRYTASKDAADLLRPEWAEYEISTLYGLAHFECPLNGGDANPPISVRRKDGNVTLAICEWRIEYELSKQD